jgi:hypothetical protein
MKKALYAFAAAILLALAGASGCCYDVPENGEFCFIIVPIFGEGSGGVPDATALEPVHCSQLR